MKSEEAEEWNRLFEESMCPKCKEAFYHLRLQEEGHAACIARVAALPGPKDVPTAMAELAEALRSADRLLGKKEFDA